MDIERFIQLDEQWHEMMAKFTREQREEYISQLPKQDGLITPLKVNFKMEDLLARGYATLDDIHKILLGDSNEPEKANVENQPIENDGVNAEKFLNEMKEKYGIKKVAKESPTPKLNVYHCQSEAQGGTIEEKCINCAKEAIAALFPDVQVESACLRRSYYCKEDLLKSAEDFPSRTNYKIKEKEYREYRDWLEKTLREKHFKEYYELSVEVFTDATKTKTQNWTVEVEINLKEAVVIRNGVEFQRFFNSLEPDYNYVWEGLNEYFGNAIDLS